MELKICLCSLSKLCVNEDWTFSVHPEWHLSQSSLSRVVSPFPPMPQSSSKLYSSLGQIHRKTEIKHTPHMCNRCSHYRDFLKMILPIWIRTIRKSQIFTFIAKDTMRSSQTHLFPPLQMRSPCSHPWVAGTAVADLYFVPSHLQCFPTHSLKRTWHLRRLEGLGGRSVLGPPSVALSLIFFSNEPQRTLGKYPEPVCSAHAPEMGIGMSQHSFPKLRSFKSHAINQHLVH